MKETFLIKAEMTVTEMNKNQKVLGCGKNDF